MTHEFRGCIHCDGPNYRSGPQCHSCWNAYMREYRRTHPKPVTTEQARIKANARRRARRAVAQGKIRREPCEWCGSPRAEIHHPDYARPGDIRWLCKECHHRLHKVQKIAPVDLRKPPSWVTKEPVFE